jgi:urea carboxylase
MTHLEAHPPPGLIDLTPGIRSLQVHFDPRRTDSEAVAARILEADDHLPDPLDMEVASRVVRLPLSWEDPSVLTAIDRYTQSVRPDAPWCPSNIEFIRRINGLDHVDDVREIVFGASYLVLGLGDVYLGAPVATPLDPRHRLVTTKYNPARTWTPENAVGIGGAYMCVYGMEGPGGYQLVGRTVPIWNTYRQTDNFTQGSPWLLRFFDRIEFFPVDAQELTDWRRGMRDGTRPVTVTDGTLRMGEYRAFLDGIRTETTTFRDRQRAAFAQERARWANAPEFVAPEVEDRVQGDADTTDQHAVRAPLAANVWQVLVAPGAAVAKGDVVAILEAMKMEVPVEATVDGVVAAVRCQPSDVVFPGQSLMSIELGSGIA